MATYTYTQLYGSGSIGENLTGQKLLPLLIRVGLLILQWKPFVIQEDFITPIL
jgi:hypothetical protein